MSIDHALMHKLLAFESAIQRDLAQTDVRHVETILSKYILRREVGLGKKHGRGR